MQPLHWSLSSFSLFVVNLAHPDSLLPASWLSFSPPRLSFASPIQSTFRPLSPSRVPYPRHPTLHSLASHSAPLVWHLWRMNIREEHLKGEGQEISPPRLELWPRGGWLAVWCLERGHLREDSSCYHQQEYFTILYTAHMWQFAHLYTINFICKW